MKLKIEIENKSIPLLIIPEWDYIHLEFKEPSTQIIESNSHWGTIKIGSLNKESTLNLGLAKRLALIEKGLLFPTYKTLKPYFNLSLYQLLDRIFEKNRVYNLLRQSLGTSQKKTCLFSYPKTMTLMK